MSLFEKAKRFLRLRLSHTLIPPFPPVCFPVQGGYNLQATAEAACASLRSLLGDPCPHLNSPGAPSERSDTTSNTFLCLRSMTLPPPPFISLRLCPLQRSEVRLQDAFCSVSVLDQPPDSGWDSTCLHLLHLCFVSYVDNIDHSGSLRSPIEARLLLDR